MSDHPDGSYPSQWYKQYCNLAIPPTHFIYLKKPDKRPSQNSPIPYNTQGSVLNNILLKRRWGLSVIGWRYESSVCGPKGRQGLSV